MNRISTLLAAAWLAAIVAGPALAQEDAGAGSRVLGTVVKGDTTIVFEAANRSDLPQIAQLKTWNEFATQHPEVARELAAKPRSIGNADYLAKHPELSKFFDEHPDIREAMIEEPGNFVAVQR